MGGLFVRGGRAGEEEEGMGLIYKRV